MDRKELYKNEIDKELKHIRNSYIKINSYIGKLQNQRVMGNQTILDEDEINQIKNKVKLKAKIVNKLF